MSACSQAVSMVQLLSGHLTDVLLSLTSYAIGTVTIMHAGNANLCCQIHDFLC